MQRVLLTSLAPERIAELLRQIKLNQLTEKSVTGSVQLRKLLTQVRQQGYSIVDEKMMFGLRAIAVPLRNKRGDIVASINACGNRRSLEIAYLKDTMLSALAQAPEKIRLMFPPEPTPRERRTRYDLRPDQGAS
jgi:IclR family transcriptional regulator, pca regulon regulatory protein